MILGAHNIISSKLDFLVSFLYCCVSVKTNTIFSSSIFCPRYNFHVSCSVFVHSVAYLFVFSVFMIFVVIISYVTMETKTVRRQYGRPRVRV